MKSERFTIDNIIKFADIMSAQEQKYSRRASRSLAFTSVVSISLVLLVLGAVGLLVFNVNKASVYIKENIGFSVILKDNVKDADIAQFQKTLDSESYVKSSEYITKERAMEIFNEEHGENAVEFVGYIPLKSSIDVKILAEYANPDSIAWIQEGIANDARVHEFWYNPNLLEAVNKNIKQISLISGAIVAILAFIAIVLINNSIRLSIYSKRLLIRSMQLVGATKGFIRRPFLAQGVSYGIYGAIIANGTLLGMIYYFESKFPDFLDLQDIEMFGIVFGGVFIVGIIITYISTFLAVRKYLRMRPEQLY